MDKERSFKEQMSLFNSAGFACINLISKEETVAFAEICSAFEKNPNIVIKKYSHASGLTTYSNGKAIHAEEVEPDSLIRQFVKHVSSGEDCKTVLVIPDFGELLKRDPELRRGLRERIWWCRNTGNQIILISTKQEEIPEIENDVTIYRHGLPDSELTESNLRSMAETYDVTMDQEEIDRCVESLSGMTSYAQEDAISLSLVETKNKGKQKIDPLILLESKEREIAKRPYLKIVKPDVSFDDIVGHDLLKSWAITRRSGFTKEARDFGIKKPPKGTLLVGPPGTGKTLFAKALTSAWGGMPLLQFNIGAIFTSMLGDSEANIRDAIEIAERMAPCIFWIDEINRAFGSKGGEKDGGTQERITAELLTWMSEKTAPVFVLATANDVTGMPPEMLRKGRFDEIWSVNIPDFETRANIFELYLKGKEIDEEENPARLLATLTDGFIPAEIEEVVNGAHYRAFERFSATGEGRGIQQDDVAEEIRQMVPLSVSMKDKFDQLKNWADKNARSTVKVEAVSNANVETVRKLSIR